MVVVVVVLSVAGCIWWGRLMLLVARIVVRAVLVVVAGRWGVLSIVSNADVAHQFAQQAEEAGLRLDCALAGAREGAFVFVVFAGSGTWMRKLVVRVWVHLFIQLAVS